jgi:hypothetical protein
MNEAAQRPTPRRVLRVAIAAADPVRRTGLTAIVLNAGHAISDDADVADVVLADSIVPGSGLPAVTLGGNDTMQRGLLPRDASPDQIDAAIRAVAVGLVVRPAEAPRPVFDAVAEQELNLLTPREVEGSRRGRQRAQQQGCCPPAWHLAAHREVPRRVAAA